jgi:SMI1 / KNR4 family (SUKH-1)
MLKGDLKRLEDALGRPLSPAVRQFFLNFPPELREIVSDPDVDDFVLTDDVESLIEMNDRTRSYLPPLDWSPKILILGAGGCGETFWVDLDDERGAVYRFEAGQEAQFSDHLADSLDEFARGMIGLDEEG